MSGQVALTEFEPEPDSPPQTVNGWELMEKNLPCSRDWFNAEVDGHEVQVSINPATECVFVYADYHSVSDHFAAFRECDDVMETAIEWMENNAPEGLDV